MLDDRQLSPISLFADVLVCRRAVLTVAFVLLVRRGAFAERGSLSPLRSLLDQTLVVVVSLPVALLLLMVFFRAS